MVAPQLRQHVLFRMNLHRVNSPSEINLLPNGIEATTETSVDDRGEKNRHTLNDSA